MLVKLVQDKKIEKCRRFGVKIIKTKMSEERQQLLKQQEALDQKLKALERKEKKKYAEDYAVVEKQLADIIKIKKDDSKKEKTTNLKNKIITAPTQVGKTKAIIELCKNCDGWLSVISCDNKSDQMKQLLGRVKQEQINAYSLKDVIKKTKTVKNHLDNNENVIIVMLNNESQVSSLTAFFEKLMLIVAVKKYICIHDESDMVNKSDNITDLHNQKIAKSHREWIKHFHIVKGLKVPVMRRIWVTATAENCSNLYDICGKELLLFFELLNNSNNF